MDMNDFLARLLKGKTNERLLAKIKPFCSST
jgi:hypothetical protein